MSNTMHQAKILINGVSKASSVTADVINPATEEVFAKCHISSVEDIDNAVAAARSAFSAWSELGDEVRKGKLLELASAIEGAMPELMEIVTKESGKPLGGLNGIGSGMEVGGSIAWTQATTSFELPVEIVQDNDCLLYTSPSPRDQRGSRMPSSA